MTSGRHFRVDEGEWELDPYEDDPYQGDPRYEYPDPEPVVEPRVPVTARASREPLPAASRRAWREADESKARTFDAYDDDDSYDDSYDDDSYDDYDDVVDLGDYRRRRGVRDESLQRNARVLALGLVVVILLVIGLLMVGGSSDTTENAEAPSVIPSTSGQLASDEAEPDPSEIPPVNSPRPLNAASRQPIPDAPSTPTGEEDLEAVVASLLQQKASIEQNPELDLSTTFEPGSSAFEHKEKDLAVLRANGAASSRPMPRIDAVEIVGQRDRVATARVATAYVDGSQFTETLTLAKGDDGVWRISGYVVESRP